jgi:hypothetical protein
VPAQPRSVTSTRQIDAAIVPKQRGTRIPRPQLNRSHHVGGSSESEEPLGEGAPTATPRCSSRWLQSRQPCTSVRRCRFSASEPIPSAARTTKFLVDALEAKLKASPPVFPTADPS